MSSVSIKGYSEQRGLHQFLRNQIYGCFDALNEMVQLFQVIIRQRPIKLILSLITFGNNVLSFILTILDCYQKH